VRVALTTKTRAKWGRLPCPALACLLVALLGSTYASAAVVEKRMTLRDVSDSGSPIRVSGRLTFRDDGSKVTPFSYQITATAKNVSSKSVLLVIHFQASGMGGPGHDEQYSQEYFFTEPLEPDAIEKYESGHSSFGPREAPVSPDADSEPERPAATTSVEFVQFSDGSTWGDADAAADVLEIRRNTVRELGSLEHIYEESGEQAFRAEFSRDSYLPSINSLKYACKSKEDYWSCARNGVRRAIETAFANEAAANSDAAHPLAELP
jgi:hypothetical protein